MTVRRSIGTETEFGIYRPGYPHANPVALSTDIVEFVGVESRVGTAAAGSEPVLWDYTAEDPLNDLRGMRMSRLAADPSLLTDDPYHLAPSGGTQRVSRPMHEEFHRGAITNTVLTNGARFYVDHAHPEYSAPETSNPFDAVLWDRAGDFIASAIMEQRAQLGADEIILVKNNTDGKGAAYGTHENYQVARLVDLDDLIRGLTPFFVTRPVICGSGRVGIGQTSAVPGFQISQRADFVENDIGLETTFNRPIINTRDEPHADPVKYRRLHVIGGDANLFDYSALLRFGTTSLVLWALEQGTGLEWDALALEDPVKESWAVSHDPTLKHKVTTRTGAQYTAVEMQKLYLDLVVKTFDDQGIEPDDQTMQILQLWYETLAALQTDLFSVAQDIEWVAKYQLLLRQKDRLGCGWDDPRLAAMDLQWADLRPSHSLVQRLDNAGMVRRIFTPDQVRNAAVHAPADTRASLRGYAVAHCRTLVRASWTSLVFDNGGPDLIRLPLPETQGNFDTVMAEIRRIGNPA